MCEKETVSTDENCLDFVTQTAYDNFGIKYLYPWQRLVVANILEAYEYWKNPHWASTDERLKCSNDTLHVYGQLLYLLSVPQCYIPYRNHHPHRYPNRCLFPTDS